MKNKEIKNSIIEEAIADLEAILETADKSARNRMVKELPNEFEKLLKEELEKNKKESVKESVKDKKKEPIKEDKKTDDDNKESLNEMNEIDMTELSIDDIEEAYNEASATDEFEVSPDEINIDDVERELEAMEAGNDAIDEMGSSSYQIRNLTSQGHPKPKTTSNMQREGENDPYKEKLKNLHKMLGEMIQDNEQTNEMHEKVPHGATAPADKGHNTTPSGINEDIMNEDISPELIQSAIGLLGVIGASGGLGLLQQKLKGTKAGQFLEKLGSSASSGIAGGSLPVNRASESVDDREDYEEIDENLTNTHAAQRKVQGGHSPNIDVAGKHRDGRTRPAQRSGGVNESTEKRWSNESVKKFISQKENLEKRMNGLIEENKKLTKKVNESKDNQKKIEKLTEDQKKFNNVLVKYRDQLTEMAVFNTNLANVNSILLNENLALTTEDKKEIINKFKKVNTISESEETYKSILSDVKKSKKTLEESIEDKVNNSIDKSSSEKIVEQTAYVNEHINKIKDMMKYVDNHGNKKILK